MQESEFGVSFIIPAYNEEHRIGPTLASYLPELRKLHVPFEVIVSVSGTDHTPEVIDRFRDQGVKMVRFPYRVGKGRAIREGILKARYSIVAYTDADGSVPADEAVRLIRKGLDGKQVIVASRRLDPSTVVVGEPPTKHLASTIWHLVVNSLLDLGVKDAECGFKVFPKEAAQRTIRQVAVTNWCFDVDMLYHLRKEGIPLREVPVRYSYNLQSRMRLVRDAPLMMLTLLGIFAMNRTVLKNILPERSILLLNRTLLAN